MSRLKTFRTLASFRLHALARLSERFHEQFYKREFGLTLLECRIIGVTGGFEQVSFKRAREETDLDKSHASRIVARLIARRLLQKIDHPADQRTVMLSLTPRGRTTHRALHASAAALAERWLSVLSAEQRRTFETALVVLIEQIRVMTENGGRGPPARLPGTKPRQAAEALFGELVMNEKLARQLYQLLGTALGERTARAPPRARSRDRPRAPSRPRSRSRPRVRAATRHRTGPR